MRIVWMLRIGGLENSAIFEACEKNIREIRKMRKICRHAAGVSCKG